MKLKWFVIGFAALMAVALGGTMMLASHDAPSARAKRSAELPSIHVAMVELPQEEDRAGGDHKMPDPRALPRAVDAPPAEPVPEPEPVVAGNQLRPVQEKERLANTRDVDDLLGALGGSGGSRFGAKDRGERARGGKGSTAAPSSGLIADPTGGLPGTQAMQRGFRQGLDESNGDGFAREGRSPMARRGAVPDYAPSSDGDELDGDFHLSDEKAARARPKKEKKPMAPARSQGTIHGGRKSGFVGRMDSTITRGELDRLRLLGIEPYEPDAGAPATTLPAMAYFENTYLGGNAAHLEQLRRMNAHITSSARPWDRVTLPPQPFDGPADAGLGLSVSVDRTHIDKPGRVLLQVGITGSGRAGWRRPPLDLVVVLDARALAVPRATVGVLGALVARMGAADRLAVRRAGDTHPIVPLSRPDVVRRALIDHPDRLLAPAPGNLAAVRDAIGGAGRDLEAAADSGRIPGTGLVLVVVGPNGPAPDAQVTAAAHRLTTEGVTVSVLEAVEGAFAPRSEWWRVAHAGHGGHHRIGGASMVDPAVEAELDRVSRVVARLVRVNVGLGPGVKAIRVLGSRLLDAKEVKQVKAREKAVDDRLSRTMGVKSDRGDDDDGLQTVIPYFLGDDTHVILIELWAERAGPVADVTVRYKDMVRLDNGKASARVALGPLPRPIGPVEAQVRRNAHGVTFAQTLARAASLARSGSADLGSMLRAARALAVDRHDHRIVDALAQMVASSGRARAADAFDISARRRLGVGHALALATPR